MTVKPISLKPESDYEARPIALLVQVASQYESSIYIESENKKINAKSIMGMMSLGLLKGHQITVVADGPDEEAAIKGIENYMVKEM